jgi:tRNA (guanine37-N1)-methyltransferase
MRFDIITIFPKIFDSYLGESLFKRAQKSGIVKIIAHNLRDFTNDKHKRACPTGRRQSFGRVDDKPFGGGPGMVLQIEPIYKAVQFLKLKVKSEKLSARGGSAFGGKVRTILFSTRGKKLDAKTAKRLARHKQLILICGRYEGVDERVAKYVADEEISIGDYVLSGGELAALVLIESVSRFLPGFLGKRESLEEIKGSYPVYTRPEVFLPSGKRQWKVPKVLLSGDHKKIREWREKYQDRK